MKITSFILLLLIVLSLSVTAQKNRPVGFHKSLPSKREKIDHLKIGDKVPNVLISKILNDKSASARMFDFADQLLILDFWATTCSSCVEALPHIMELQQEFGNRIKMLPVTHETMDIISKFLVKNRYLRNTKVITVIEDKILSALFKHNAQPHEVWIYKGKVIAITEKDYVTRKNIQLILDGKKNDWPLKDDFLPWVDVKKPLMRPNAKQFLGNPDLKRYAAIFGYRVGPPFSTNGSSYDSVNRLLRTYVVNLPIYNIYLVNWNKIRAATGKSPLFPVPTNIVFEVKDLSRFIKTDGNATNFDIARKTWICYESVTADTGRTVEQRSRDIINDLDYLLGLYGRFEHRKIKCLALIRSDSTEKFRSIAEERDNHLDGSVKTFRKDTFDNLVWEINQHYGNPPFFNETGYTGEVDLDLKFDSWKNIPALRASLQAYGLDLREEERELEVFVLTEKNNK
ncbi:TlpA family protein disulfide reductase [Pedobacter steynii]|uniref:Thioredoxin domain-containing protein n=1 Tax=Pedobacter steynii TaxID=430522 RepID=A0A1D7QB75_9SPHI|nr:thioredoxin domain-containing protein [Pedobacter steynii]AOM75950.1 hypothetical protein BFS30_01440 [Pedobacter steynii]